MLLERIERTVFYTVDRERPLLPQSAGGRNGLSGWARPRVAIRFDDSGHAGCGLDRARPGAGCCVPTPGSGRPGQTATNPLRYQVNYRATANDPWQLYASTRSLRKANAIAAEVKSTGYLTRCRQQPDARPAAITPILRRPSASRYYPTSNWSSDYNYYVVPGGNYNYGWYGGWNPWYGYRSYPNYWWNGGRSYYGAGWGGHYWGGGWRRGGGWGGAGWSGGAWSGNHRNWNNSHVDRSTHGATMSGTANRLIISTTPQQHSAGHHQPGHHAAARHASHASAEHRGAGHRGSGAAPAPAAIERAAHHAARGHGGGARWRRHRRSPGGHAAAHHAGHHDP